MKLSGNFLFMGCTAAPSYKDHSKIVYKAGFMDGLDSMTSYIDQLDYESLRALPELTPVRVVFDFNPFNSRVNFVECKALDVKSKTA